MVEKGASCHEQGRDHAASLDRTTPCLTSNRHPGCPGRRRGRPVGGGLRPAATGPPGRSVRPAPPPAAPPATQPPAATQAPAAPAATQAPAAAPTQAAPAAPKPTEA